jgi:hypothetical protein
VAAAEGTDAVRRVRQRGNWPAAIWTGVVNVAVNACPVLVQRYNRARLLAVFPSLATGHDSTV